MVRNLSQKEATEWALFIIVVLLGIMIAILSFLIVVIHVFQALFWIFLLFILPASVIFFVIFLNWGVLKEDQAYSNDLYHSDDSFDKPKIFMLAGGFFVLILISILAIAFFYEKGYSDEALNKLAVYENQLQSLQDLQDIFSGQLIWKIQNQVIEETVNNLCKDSNYSCDAINKSYQAYKDIKGAKDSADEMAEFLRLIKR